ncbi:MAG: glycoside hydrolase family 43 protein [Lachnospiraceae bacterium]|nr:glycoside hydrolase family 43 protein [Lachnospiraceae bacterium]
MKYKNPVISGFYPDPSVCAANGKYYMVCSSFQYFPGVPLFESEDLVNWKQLGYVLTRKSQVMLENIGSSGGVFAPTIRYHEGRFYMVTTNDTTHQNFYVYTDDIYKEWSDPVYVAQGGIDPSLYFEDGHVYFMSNGCDDAGVGGVTQCEIDIASGKKLSESKCIWKGSGGRFLESPHLYHIDGYYYLMAAEGGTEYGHMITYARGTSVWGPFENYAHNPVLTNRNKAPFIIQGIGHGDLIKDDNGDWHIFCLGFRQMHMWRPYHTLGREVFLIPVRFDGDGWFHAGADGTADFEYELKGTFSQQIKKEYTFENTDFGIDWCYLRHPDESRYELSADRAVLYGGGETLDDVASPTFLAMRQKEFAFRLSVLLKLEELSAAESDTAAQQPKTAAESDKEAASGLADGQADKALWVYRDAQSARMPEAGVTLYSCENEHYEVAIISRRGAENTNGGAAAGANDKTAAGSKTGAGVRADAAGDYEVILRLNIGGIRQIQAALPIPTDSAKLIVKGENTVYHFFVETDEKELYLGTGQAKYLSSEVVEGFTGVMIGCYAVGGCRAEFTKLNLIYEDPAYL